MRRGFHHFGTSSGPHRHCRVCGSETWWDRLVARWRAPARGSLVEPVPPRGLADSLREVIASATVGEVTSDGAAWGILLELEQYAIHVDECRAAIDGFARDPRCDCGLSRLLEATTTELMDGRP